MMATPGTVRLDAARTREVPPLQHGDRLSRAEFERRYEAMPEVRKAELIEGVVHMPSPVRLEHHGSPAVDITSWLGVYRGLTPGVVAGHNTSVRLEPESMPQPEMLLLIDPALGGRARISSDDYVEGSPELLAEVSASTKSIDLVEKFQLYRENKIQEYIVWRVDDRAIDWFVLRGVQHDRLLPGQDGIIRSEVFPGLWLDPEAMIRGDFARVLQVLQQGIASPEHAAFVARLRQAGAQPGQP
jgi:Uma2 family endonuclease